MNDDTNNTDEGLNNAPLSEDNDTPFAPADDTAQSETDDSGVQDSNDQLDPTHQVTDSATNIDSHELHDEGLSGATEASEPNADSAVVDYSPDDIEKETEQA